MRQYRSNPRDFYEVGRARGVGGTGIWDGRQLAVSANWQSYHVYANGPLRAIFDLTYEPWDAGNGVKVTECKRFIVDAGQQLDEVQSTFDFTPAPGSDGSLTVAIGLTEHPAAADVQVSADERGKLLAIWEKYRDHPSHDELGTGVVLAAEDQWRACEDWNRPVTLKISQRLQFLLWLVGCALLALPVHAQPLRVMTFNVRFLTQNDGANNWDARRDLAAEVLRAEDPDVIGTQELFKRQGDDIVERLPQFVWFGEGRGGGDGDEHMGMFYRKDRLRVLESGNFWLSDTPGIPGSRTWGNIYPRMVTWARFERIADGATFTLYNTHLPYRDIDEPARIRSAELIRARLQQLPRSERLILIGDFNTTSTSRVYSTLTESLTDAWTTAPQRSGPDGTFHDFTGKPERRIDWILFRGLKANRVQTITMQRNGRYPSDHFPVVAEFDLP